MSRLRDSEIVSAVVYQFDVPRTRARDDGIRPKQICNPIALIGAAGNAALFAGVGSRVDPRD